MIISTFFGNIMAAAAQNGLSADEIAARCVGLGITGIDIEEGELSDPALSSLLAAGMKITSLIARKDIIHYDSETIAEEVVNAAKACSSPGVLLIPGYLSDTDVRSLAENAIAPLKRIAALASKYNITIGVEDYDHPAVPTSTTAGLSLYLDNVPELSCFFDTGNFIFMAEDVRDAYIKLGGRITTQIHCKDRSLTGRPGENPMRSMDGTDLYPCAVGSGIIPVREIVTDALRKGFDGILTLELFGTADTLGDLEKSASFIKRCITEA